MPSKNTNHARKKGYSDITRMEKDNSKSPTLKNYGVKLGKLKGERVGKSPANPPKQNDSHWIQPNHGMDQRQYI
jgi:hypothetical protein